MVFFGKRLLKLPRQVSWSSMLTRTGSLIDRAGMKRRTSDKEVADAVARFPLAGEKFDDMIAIMGSEYGMRVNLG
jgi:hypothetical protein